MAEHQEVGPRGGHAPLHLVVPVLQETPGLERLCVCIGFLVTVDCPMGRTDVRPRGNKRPVRKPEILQCLANQDNY